LTLAAHADNNIFVKGKKWRETNIQNKS